VQAEAEAMRDRVREFLPGGEIPIVQITPVLGSHLGIGALGFACVSIKES
jgi:fatty acid-binding protein DegV